MSDIDFTFSADIPDGLRIRHDKYGLRADFHNVDPYKFDILVENFGTTEPKTLHIAESDRSFRTVKIDIGVQCITATFFFRKSAEVSFFIQPSERLISKSVAVPVERISGFFLEAI